MAARQTTTRIPTAPTSFVGRSCDLEVISRLLSQPNVRLVTVTGPGGVGKTRVALETVNAFENASDHFPDGIWFASLAPIRDSELALTAIASAAGVTVSGRQSPVTALARAMRDKRGLLVMDNLEQIAGIAEPVRFNRHCLFDDRSCRLFLPLPVVSCSEHYIQVSLLS